MRAACDPAASDDLKREGMLAVYQMRHLKSVCSEDRIYALPSSTSGFLEDLTSVTKQAALTQAPQFGPQAVSGTSFVDENMEANVPLEQPASSPVICFRLVHLQPKRQQSVNLLSSLRGDHVAVRLYDVQDVHPETKSISLSSQMELKPKADDVKLLSLSSFLSMGSETVAKTMAECEVNSEISYFFSSQSLSTLAHGKMGRSLVTKMVNAGAYPEVGGTFTLVGTNFLEDDDGTTAILLNILREYEDKFLIKQISPGKFQISHIGYFKLRKACMYLLPIYLYMYLSLSLSLSHYIYIYIYI